MARRGVVADETKTREPCMAREPAALRPYGPIRVATLGGGRGQEGTALGGMRSRLMRDGSGRRRIRTRTPKKCRRIVSQTSRTSRRTAQPPSTRLTHSKQNRIMRDSWGFVGATLQRSVVVPAAVPAPLNVPRPASRGPRLSKFNLSRPSGRESLCDYCVYYGDHAGPASTEKSSRVSRDAPAERAGDENNYGVRGETRSAGASRLTSSSFSSRACSNKMRRISNTASGCWWTWKWSAGTINSESASSR
jgi:hypothetical protein